MNKVTAYFFLLSFIGFSLSAFGQSVINGKISYKGEDRIVLSGEWEFYWDTLFANSELTHSSKFITIPGLWRKYAPDAQGFATSRLIINADKDYDQMGAFVPYTYGASELYLNGELISQCGKVADNKIDIDPR